MATYILGDVHGEYQIMWDLLNKVGLLDTHTSETGTENWVWKKGCKDTLIQVGDMIDGCNGSITSFMFLKRLQEEATKEGGKVIRLLGNHELAYISPIKCTGMDSNTALVLTDIIKQDVLHGHMNAYHLLDDYIITHSGIHKDMSKSIRINEVGNDKYTVRTVLFKEQNLNAVLFMAVGYNDFSHPIFNVGKSRGGLSDTPGIFWADWNKDALAPIKQIVGHTSMGGIIFKGKHINVDCGISRRVHKVYQILKYEDKEFEVITL
jgi:hypothetical protein